MEEKEALIVTYCQVNQFWEDKLANFNHLEKLFDDLPKTDLIVLPEMFHTGFSMNAILHADDWNKSEGLEWLKSMSMLHNTAIATSLMVKQNDCYFNRFVFVTPAGRVEHYDKVQLFKLSGEDKVFTNGTKQQIMHYKGWKIKPQVCYDLRFPENARNTVSENEFEYDLLIYVANWPEKRSAHWRTLLCARAIENQAYVIGVNRIGIDGNQLSYDGNSCIFDGLGNELSKSQNFEECSCTVNLNMNELKTLRKSLPFLQDRLN